MDPAIRAVAEIGRAAASHRPPPSMWVGDRDKVPSVVRSLLGEHSFRSMVIGCRLRDALCAELLEVVRRYGATEVLVV